MPCELCYQLIGQKTAQKKCIEDIRYLSSSLQTKNVPLQLDHIRLYMINVFKGSGVEKGLSMFL